MNQYPPSIPALPNSSRPINHFINQFKPTSLRSEVCLHARVIVS